MRRAVMLSLVLSLIVNASLLLAMAWAQIFAPPWREERQVARAKAVQPRFVVPEYLLPPLPENDQTQHEFEQPVVTGTPEAAARDISRWSSFRR